MIIAFIASNLSWSNFLGGGFLVFAFKSIVMVRLIKFRKFVRFRHTGSTQPSADIAVRILFRHDFDAFVFIVGHLEVDQSETDLRFAERLYHRKDTTSGPVRRQVKLIVVRLEFGLVSLQRFPDGGNSAD